MSRGRDPDVISVTTAAKIAGRDRYEFAQWLRKDPQAAAQFVIGTLGGKRLRISRPRLLRYLHGDATPARAS